MIGKKRTPTRKPRVQPDRARIESSQANQRLDDGTRCVSVGHRAKTQRLVPRIETQLVVHFLKCVRIVTGIGDQRETLPAGDVQHDDRPARRIRNRRNSPSECLVNLFLQIAPNGEVDIAAWLGECILDDRALSVSSEDEQKVDRFINQLDDQDDTQEVYCNIDFVALEA